MKGTGGTKRSKYVSKACEPCRQRRAKCDGHRPACSSCISKSIDCQYSTASDGRKPASKSYVQSLRDRIELLENALRSHSIDVDAAIAQMQAERSDIASAEAGSSNVTPAGIEGIRAAFEGTLSLDESVNFDEDGECHYFGPTSGRLGFQDLQDMSDNNSVFPAIGTSCNKTTSRSIYSSEVQFNPSSLSINADLQAELIDLYFVWQNPWFPVLDEAMFRQGQQHGGGRYFSSLLFYCVLAAGCRFSDKPELRTNPHDPDTAGNQLLEAAEVLLHYDMKSPSLTTIQAVSIMIYLNCSRAADAVAWLQQGTAHRLALDLGLNFDATSVTGSKYVTAEEAELRRQIYWSLYCTDKLHASYSGRVCTMLDIQGAVKLPCSDARAESSNECDLQSQRTKTLLRAHIAQSQILEKVLLGFYAPQPSVTGARREPFFNATLIELKNWLYDLPDKLRMDIGGQANDFPAVYTLHMAYYTVLILLGNGMLASNVQTIPSEAGNTITLDKRASCVCYEAAINMCIVAKKYRNKFGGFRRCPISATHCLLSAALVFMQVASNEHSLNRRKAATVNADFCIQCLDELSVSWKIAGRIHRNLTMLRARQLRTAHAANQQANAESTQSYVSTNDLSMVANSSSNTDFLFTSLDASDPTHPLLLNDAHSFIESCNIESYNIEPYNDENTDLDSHDFTAHWTASQDPYVWGSIGMDFTTGFMPPT